jgi:phasin family protein
MATPKKISETKKPEPLVIIPDSVADFTPASDAPEGMTDLAAAPIAAAEGVAHHVETAAVETLRATIAETITEPVATAAVATVADINQSTQTEIKKTMDKAYKTAEEFVTFGQGNVEAMIKSSQIWIAGWQDISKSVAATAQAQMEETVATMKTFAGLRSIKDAVDLQTSFARTSFEKALSESGKITETSLKLAEQALAPITARVTAAVEKFGRPA